MADVVELEQHVKQEVQRAFEGLRLPNLLQALERMIRQIARDVVAQELAKRAPAPMADGASAVDPEVERKAAAAAKARADFEAAKAQMAALGLVQA